MSAWFDKKDIIPEEEVWKRNVSKLNVQTCSATPITPMEIKSPAVSPTEKRKLSISKFRKEMYSSVVTNWAPKIKFNVFRFLKFFIYHMLFFFIGPLANIFILIIDGRNLIYNMSFWGIKPDFFF